MEGWSHVGNMLLIFGARLFGQPQHYANDTTSWYWTYESPTGLTKTQVFMRTQDMLGAQQIELYVRERDNLTREVTEYGRYGTQEITYYLSKKRGGGNEAATHNAQPQKDSPEQ